MKPLVPVDGSSASINAVKKSIEIAKKYGFSIKLISVVDTDNLSNYSRNEKLWRHVDGSLLIENNEIDELNEKIKEKSIKLLDTIFIKLDLLGIRVEKEVLLGEAYVNILETAKNENFDLLVMGNSGFSKIKRFFTGSVAQKVISEAPCPVLVIHTDADF